MTYHHKHVAIPLCIADRRPPIAVFWCMEEDNLWPQYALSLPQSHRPIRYDILSDCLPDTTTFTHFYISGSPFDVNSREVAQLRSYIQTVLNTADQERKIAGTCFGAQALAKWALDKTVFNAYSPEADVFKTILIDDKPYSAHFNHSWFIRADAKPDWKIHSQRRIHVLDQFAKVVHLSCVDVFSASLPGTHILGMIPHPHVMPKEGKSIAPLLADFFRVVPEAPCSAMPGKE